MDQERISALVEKYWDKVKEHRYYLHAHPELSHHEKNTAAYIAETLKKMGLTPKENVGGYGVTAEKESAWDCGRILTPFPSRSARECPSPPKPRG